MDSYREDRPAQRAADPLPRPFPAHSLPLFEVTSLNAARRLRSVVAYLLIPGSRTFEGERGQPNPPARLVTLVSACSGRVGFPGGFMDRADTSPYAGLRREWSEECGTKLPPVVELAKFVEQTNKGDTGIFLFALHDNADPNEVFFDRKRADGEASAMVWRTLSELRRACEGRENWRLRECAVGSTRVVLDWLESRGVR